MTIRTSSAWCLAFTLLLACVDADAGPKQRKRPLPPPDLPTRFDLEPMQIDAAWSPWFGRMQLVVVFRELDPKHLAAVSAHSRDSTVSYPDGAVKGMAAGAVVSAGLAASGAGAAAATSSAGATTAALGPLAIGALVGLGIVKYGERPLRAYRRSAGRGLVVQATSIDRRSGSEGRGGACRNRALLPTQEEP